MSDIEKTEDKPLDETVLGGRYLVDGRLVDAEGKEIKEEVKAETPPVPPVTPTPASTNRR